ncbi:MAG: protein kinase domain-containing protein [Planctomycetota bacterium]
MTSEHFTRVRSIIERALEQPEQERVAFLQQACEGDAELQAEAERWLAAVGEADRDGFLRPTAIDSGTGSATSKASTPLETGARLGDLILKRELGRGEQGVVFEAEQSSMGRRVAVKILQQTAAAGTDQLERFRREAEAAGRLNHSHIVIVHGFDEVDGHHLLVQEFVDGESLEDTIRQRNYSEGAVDGEHCRWAAEVCRQLAEALDHAHQHSVVHRDVKPSNVLMASDHEAKLGDFGLARVSDLMSLSRTGSIVGTPHYMSPEQLDTLRPAADGRTDVYSLGAVLYRMLTGQVPFPARTLQALFNDILTRAPRAPRSLQPGIDRDLEAVCLKCLEKQSEHRYQTAGALAEDLANYLAGRSTIARPEGVLGSLNRSLRRLAISTLAVVCVLVAVIWFTLDATALRPLTTEDVGSHGMRYLALGAAALLTAWPAALLALRLSRGRRAAMAAALVAVLALTAIGAGFVRGGQLDQQHLLARDALYAQLGGIDTREVDRLERYVTSWEGRFDAFDIQIVARGYLLAQRAPIARQWVDRLVETAPGNPLTLALEFVLSDVFGAPDAAQDAEQRLWASADRVGDWTVWLSVGHILRDARRYELARRAYGIAQRDPDVRMHRLRPALAQVSLDLCDEAQARADLAETLAVAPADPAIRRSMHRLACRIAIQTGDMDEARRHLQAYTQQVGSVPLTALDLRKEMLVEQGATEELATLLRETAGKPDASLEVLLWCGRMSMNHAPVTSFETWHGAYEFARDSFADALRLDPDSVTAELSLSAALMELADPAHGASPEDQANMLDRAEQLALSAVERDDSFFEAWGNLAHVRRLLAVREHGDYDAMPVEALESYIDPMRAALDRQSMDVRVLNDTAQGLGDLFRKTQDPDTLRQALDYSSRAVKLAQSPDASHCDVDWRLGFMHDTQRDLHELGGDRKAALESARSAAATAGLLAPLGPDQREHYADKWAAHVARLEAEIAAGK